MEEKIITQQDLERIIKKNSARYLKKLEEKEAELNQYKAQLESITNSQADYAEPAAPSLSDDEVIKKVEAILNVPVKQRSEQEEQDLETLKDAYRHAKFNKDLNDAMEWAKGNYDGDIEQILHSDEFAEFTHNINGNICDLLKKYIKFTSKPNDNVKADVKTPGSVKDTSGVVAKEYFSKEEVERMTPEQVEKYLPVIEKSMPKW